MSKKFQLETHLHGMNGARKNVKIKNLPMIYMKFAENGFL